MLKELVNANKSFSITELTIIMRLIDR